MVGRVVLVGAGPGDPDLLTVRAVRELESADVVLYDALVEPAILAHVRPGTETIDVGKRGDGSTGVAQSDIVERMLELARAGRRVVRLKGGDPFVFGRGGEEADALAAAHIPFEIVPGVSSAIAVPAYAGIPVTDRRFAASVAFVTGHRGPPELDRPVDWEGLATCVDTLVVLMGTRWLGDIVERLIRGGRRADEPAAVIERGTGPNQRVVSAPLGELAERVAEAGLTSPTVIVVGEVSRARETLQWYESRPLFGRRVLVPRAAVGSGALVLALRRRGAEPVAVPLLAFVPPEAPGALARALEPDRCDWICFTSANAVRACAEHFASPPKARIACIGDATARAAREAGLRVDLVPERALPASLAASLAARGIEGQRILYPRAARVREGLVAALEAAGAEVIEVEAYRTELPADAGPALDRALADGIDAVAFTSGSTVDHLFTLLDARDASGRVADWRRVCIGPTTEEALRARGFDAHAVAAEQTLESLAAALERSFAEPETFSG